MPIHAVTDGWILETQQTAYGFGVNGSGLLSHRYWGPRLPYLEDYPAALTPVAWASFNGSAQLTPEEYPAYGGLKYIDPCLKVTFADGVRDTVLRFDSAEVRAPDELQIHLRDRHYPLRLTLIYHVHTAYDLIERSGTIHNEGQTPIALERGWSAQWHLPPGDQYRLSHLTGRWVDEMHLRREPLLKVLRGSAPARRGHMPESI